MEATRPTRAVAPTLYFPISSRTSFKSPSHAPPSPRDPPPREPGIHHHPDCSSAPTNTLQTNSYTLLSEASSLTLANLPQRNYSTDAALPNADPPQPYSHAQLHNLGKGKRRGGQRMLEESPHAKPSLAPGMLLGCLCLQCFNANATGGYSLTYGPQRSPSWKNPPMVDESCSNKLLKHLSHLFPP
jgi:hypothetical protein